MAQTLYYTAAEIARLLQFSERTVKTMAEDGQLPGQKIGNRWRFDREQLEARLGRKLPDPGESK